MPDRPDWRDYSHEVRLIQSKTLRISLIIASSVFLALGFIGVFMPVLPTTPFLLLAAACYARSSPRFYNWMMNHRIFGLALRQWIEHRCINRKAKVLALSMLAITLIPTIIFAIPLLPVKILLALIGISVSFFILKSPSQPRSAGK